MFREYYQHFVDKSDLRGYYPHFVEISTLCGYYPHFLDTIGIGHITSYLSHNFYHILHSCILVVDIVFGHITSY